MREHSLDGLDGLLHAPLLKMIRSGKTNSAITLLETILDGAIDDARHRRPLLTKDAQAILDRTIGQVAGYREIYPRKIAGFSTSITNAEVSDWYRDRLYEAAEFERGIDLFLGTFSNTNKSK